MKGNFFFIVLAAFVAGGCNTDKVQPQNKDSFIAHTIPGTHMPDSAKPAHSKPDTVFPKSYYLSGSSIPDTVNFNSFLQEMFTFAGMATASAPPIKSPSDRLPIKIIALGDSYTIGEGVLPNERYPIQLSESLQKKGFDVEKVQIIARTGWTTSELLTGIQAANDTNTYDLALLLIGVNNQFRRLSTSAYRSEFRICLRKALQFVSSMKHRVLVVSIPDYGFTPIVASNRATISTEIDAFNLINKQETEKEGLNYVYITDISRNEDPVMVASDRLHPSAFQYHLWVQRILPIADSLLKK